MPIIPLNIGRQLNIEISFNNEKSRKQKILSSITFLTSMYVFNPNQVAIWAPWAVVEEDQAAKPEVWWENRSKFQQIKKLKSPKKVI